MKRVWNRATVAATAGGFGVRLDGKPVNLPDGGALVVAQERLAAAIAAEWQGAGQEFTRDDLPLTRLTATALKRVPARRGGIVEELAAFGMNDLLCYRAEEPELARREADAWDTWVEWASAQLGLRLRTGVGIAPVRQTDEAAAAGRVALARLADADLAGLGVIVPALGSLVLGLAVREGALAPEAACALAELDALWQEGRWGADAEAVERRRTVAADVAVAARFMMLCRG